MGLISMSVLDSVFCFLLQVLTLLIEAFSVSLTLLKIGMLGCGKGHCSSLLDSLGRDRLRVFEPMLSLV
jgi:hypothetical protein